MILLFFIFQLFFNFIFSSLLVSFYSQTLYLLSASLIISAFVINISRKKTHAALPSFIKAIFLDNIVEKVFACKVKAAEKVENAVEEGNVSAENATKDWIRFAVVIDRIAFVVYVIAFICMGFFHFV